MQCTPLVQGTQSCNKNEKYHFFSGSSSGVHYIQGIFKDWCYNKLQYHWNFILFWSVINMSIIVSTKLATSPALFIVSIFKQSCCCHLIFGGVLAYFKHKLSDKKTWEIKSLSETRRSTSMSTNNFGGCQYSTQ